jgi:hypothetical protein
MIQRRLLGVTVRTGNINTNSCIYKTSTYQYPILLHSVAASTCCTPTATSATKSTATCTYTLPNPVLYYIIAIRYASSSYSYRSNRAIKTVRAVCLYYCLSFEAKHLGSEANSPRTVRYLLTSNTVFTHDLH